MSMLAHAKGDTDPPLLTQTIGANLAAIAQRFAAREALVDLPSGRRWSYAQLEAAVSELAKAFMASGVAKGDRVGIWAPNLPEWVLVQYASARIGAILVSINPAYRTHELRYVLQQSEISVLVAAEQFKTSDYRSMIDAVRAECPALRAVVYIATDDWNALLARSAEVTAAQLHERAAKLDHRDAINIQYTSGTTGFPKGALLSHHNILNNGYFVALTQRFSELERVCVPVPFYHCFGMVMGNLGATSHGACIVIPAPAFDPAATLRAVAAERCTVLYGVPTMFIAELSDASFSEHDLGTLRTGVMAGSPCNVYPREVEEFLYTHPATRHDPAVAPSAILQDGSRTLGASRQTRSSGCYPTSESVATIP